ncbi:MAG: hypothetical protein MAG453_01060 [Calditrichaeota bacterium]|nr:hypothetical protein [Calditrichota bacterium]
MKPTFALTIVFLLAIPVTLFAQNPPSGLSATHDGQGQVTLTWNPPAGPDGARGWRSLIEWPETPAERRDWRRPDFHELRARWAREHETRELDDFVHYRVYRNGAHIAICELETYVDQLPQPGAYTYTVTAFYDEGESDPSNEATVVWYDPDNWVLLEDFDDGLPETWTIEATVTTNTWQWDSGNIWDLFDTPYMVVDADANGSGGPHMMERLITPELDLTDATYVELEYNHTLRVYIEEHGYVEYRTDGDWETIADHAGDIEPPVTENHDLTDELAGAESAEISFYYDDMDNWGWFWGVDDVSVYMEAPVGPVVLDLIPMVTTVPAGGGVIAYDLSLESTLPNTIPGLTYWTAATLPNGQTVGPLMQIPFTHPPFMDVFIVGLGEYVPPGAPAGSYTFHGYAGFFPDVVLEDSFPFTKVAVGAASAGFDPEDWAPVGDASALAGGSAKHAGDARQEIPGGYALDPAQPNPFNAATTLALRLPEASDTRVTVFSIAGRRVATLADGRLSAGTHSLTFDGSALASGIYFVRAESAGGFTATGKLALLK